eukprot:TRINITY_DN2243_c0_g1_i1.p1 TRINITY_DN2243_c0_g1~~TRINITY_DN2243_c0_g1_i1.p1  ORF type:complete len:307 (-),score=47.40 TRINITY_DN2243_c0_g1_i1:292-1212(-)
MSVLEKLKYLDFFHKVQDDAIHRSSLSGIVTLVCGVFMAYLMIDELVRFSTSTVTSEVGVDLQIGAKLPIHFNFTFPGLYCDAFGLDFLDNAGELSLEVMDNIKKEPFLVNGRPVKGCNTYGQLLTNKVSGDFHIAFGRQSIAMEDKRSHIHRFTPQELDTFNASHIIHKLAFGENVPGVKNPLDGSVQIVTQDSAQFQYHLQVIPTVYVHSNGKITKSNQYTHTLKHYQVNTHASSFKQPGIFFKYELSPYQVTYKEHREQFSHFIASLCAILGGVFVVGGWMAGFVKPLVTPKQKRAVLPNRIK